MAHPRFILELPSIYLPETRVVELRGGEHHHLTRVLRVVPGEIVEVVDSKGQKLLTGSVLSSGRESTAISITEVRPLKESCSITAVIGLPERAAADFIVEKLTELGIQRIAFFIAERTQGGRSRLNSSALTRWKKISLSAVKQSRLLSVPAIYVEANLAEALSSLGSPQPEHGVVALTGTEAGTTPSKSRNFLDFITQKREKINRISDAARVHPGNGAESKHKQENVVKEAITSAPTASSEFKHLTPYADSLFVVGPEGGLTGLEAERALAYGLQPITLGSSILRVETAALLIGGLFRIAYENRD